ncbi:MAG: ABC transporter ATP-binding protein [bacterium]
MIDKIKWLWKFYRDFPKALIALILVTPVYAFLFMATPLLIGYFVDLRVKGEASLPHYLRFLEQVPGLLGLDSSTGAVLLILLLGALIWLTYIPLQGLRAWMNIRLEWAFRQQAFAATTQMGPDFFNKFRTGDLVTRLTDDVAEKLSWFACSGIWRFYEALCLVGFGLYAMISLNGTLTIFTAGVLPVLVVIYIKVISLLDRRFERLQKQISNVNNAMESCYSGIRVVKAYNRQGFWRRKFAEIMASRRKAEIGAVRSWVGVYQLWMSVPHLGVVALLLAGGYLVMVTHSITTGDFVAFDSLVFFLTFPMFSIGDFVVRGRQAGVSVGRLMEVETHPPMVPDGERNGKVVQFDRIRFENVSFTFAGVERNLVDKVNLTVEKGETIALVGKVGSGKSWLVNMLTRLVDPTEGGIYVGERNLTEIPLASYRDAIGYVPQEPVLFSGTIAENVRFGNDGASLERIAEVIALAQLNDLVAGSAKGLETRIGTRGINISGGEKQRLSIARALIRDPRILLLDDCTSALDASTEEKLWDELHEVMPEMTCFVVTHRTKTLKRADRIVLFEDGRIVEVGTHEDLVARSEQYRELYSRSELEEQVGVPTAKV